MAMGTRPPLTRRVPALNGAGYGEKKIPAGLVNGKFFDLTGMTEAGMEVADPSPFTRIPASDRWAPVVID